MMAFVQASTKRMTPFLLYVVGRGRVCHLVAYPVHHRTNAPRDNGNPAAFERGELMGAGRK